MRRLIAGLTIVGFLLTLSASTFAATQTISGQLIDQTCYKTKKSLFNRCEMSKTYGTTLCILDR
jgi:hypothetical protein